MSAEPLRQSRRETLLELVRLSGGECSSCLLTDLAVELGYRHDPTQTESDLDSLNRAGYLRRSKAGRVKLFRLTASGFLTAAFLRSRRQGRSVEELALDDWMATA